MDYNFSEIEKKWQKEWAKNNVYHVENQSDKPKFYVLDMFPYPSGAGLHVGHPLGYIASDIFARYKRLKGFNVLHPMGYDAYGLPAEQYAIQTGQHPAITTQININRYREQLDKLGFCFDWSREVRTCDPKYYKWTQWGFLQLFNSYYCYQAAQARPIEELIMVFEQQGTKDLQIAQTEDITFTAEEWNAKSEKEKQQILMNYRLAYLADTMVNWCPALGTVLANDEVVNGLSVRGGHPVIRKKMKQWLLRITAYAQRLLDGLDTIEWSESIKEIQRNWIGRSEGAAIDFSIDGNDLKMKVFTTRPDTIFGVSFMVLCPEHELIEQLTTEAQKEAVKEYVTTAKNRSERERQAEVKSVTGVFTGSYAINPFNGNKIPIWVADYVLAGYGTGAIMAVPAHDSRDFAFAKKFQLPIIQVIAMEGEEITPTDTWENAKESKDGHCINSDFITDLPCKEAIKAVIARIEAAKIGYKTINYRLRDAIFSRQRYWGEPFPIYYKDEMPYPIDEQDLPLILPEIDKYEPTQTGEPPLARAKNWTYHNFPLDCNTMPGFAGSNAYYLRYMNPDCTTQYIDKQANRYWQNVDLYIGGSEHATGHLLYSRMWNKFLYDLGLVCKDEPFAKLVNQGMIQGRSSIVYRINGTNTFVSYNLRKDYQTTPLHVDINLVDNDILDTERFKQWMPDFANAEFILENEKYICGHEIEKMSKSLYNVQNPDDLVEKYGADTLRMYEMFLGPVEQSKPWDTKGIEGVFRFIKKFWRLYHPNGVDFCVSEAQPTEAELKILHKTIQKIEQDIERLSYNTSVSAFMICTNELTDLKCNKRAILEPLTILIAPFAPHLAEELWHLLSHSDFVCNAKFPVYEERYLTQDSIVYPVSFNGKMRFTLNFSANATTQEIENAVLTAPESQKWLDGKKPKKVIVVPKKIVNVVI
ncbi:MAG: leucine--tRNA ligase [Bacteroidales bacterium]|jgi:leucyl-tRNA synthetase|nr:leucine--tRNA ligase [Bacteroidales bacterium]